MTIYNKNTFYDYICNKTNPIYELCMYEVNFANIQQISNWNSTI